MTIAINPTPPTAPVGFVRTDAAAVDSQGNIWVRFNKPAGGWTYAATISGGLPFEAQAQEEPSGEAPAQSTQDE